MKSKLLHHQIVDLDVSPLVGSAVRAADGQPMAVGAQGQGGTAGIQNNVLADNVPIARRIVVPVHPDVGLLGVVSPPVLVGVVEALLVLVLQPPSAEGGSPLGGIGSGDRRPLGPAGEAPPGTVEGGLASVPRPADGDGVAVPAEGEGGGARHPVGGRADADALAVPPPAGGGIAVLHHADLARLGVGAVGQGGVGVLEDVAVGKADGGCATVARQGRMARDEVREGVLHLPPSAAEGILVHPAAEDQGRSIAAQLNAEIKVIRAQHIVLLHPLSLGAKVHQLEHGGDAGTDAADGIGIVRHGQGGSVVAEADGASPPNVDDAGTIDAPRVGGRDVSIRGHDGFGGVGHGHLLSVSGHGGDLAREGGAEGGPISTLGQIELVDLDGGGGGRGDGEVVPVGGEGHGRSDRGEGRVGEVRGRQPDGGTGFGSAFSGSCGGRSTPTTTSRDPRAGLGTRRRHVLGGARLALLLPLLLVLLILRRLPDGHHVLVHHLRHLVLVPVVVVLLGLPLLPLAVPVLVDVPPVAEGVAAVGACRGGAAAVGIGAGSADGRTDRGADDAHHRDGRGHLHPPGVQKSNQTGIVLVSMVVGPMMVVALVHVLSWRRGGYGKVRGGGGTAGGGQVGIARVVGRGVRAGGAEVHIPHVGGTAGGADAAHLPHQTGGRQLPPDGAQRLGRRRGATPLGVQGGEGGLNIAVAGMDEGVAARRTGGGDSVGSVDGIGEGQAFLAGRPVRGRHLDAVAVGRVVDVGEGGGGAGIVGGGGHGRTARTAGAGATAAGTVPGAVKGPAVGPAIQRGAEDGRRLVVGVVIAVLGHHLRWVLVAISVRVCMCLFVPSLPPQKEQTYSNSNRSRCGAVRGGAWDRACKEKKREHERKPENEVRSECVTGNYRPSESSLGICNDAIVSVMLNCR